MTITLSDIGSAKPRWLWPNRIPLGAITLLVGAPGEGKSTVVADIVGRVTTGRPMYGCDGKPEEADVLLLCAEDDLATTVKPRLVAAGAATKRVHAVAENLRLPRDIPEIARAVGDLRPRLIVIDPLMAYLDGSANHDQSARKALTPLAKLARDANASLVLVHHTNKSSTSALFRSAGSIGIVGAARAALLVAQLPGESGQCVLAAIKSNLSALAQSITFRRMDRHGASAVEWLGYSRYTADEVVGLRGNGSLDEAIRVLYITLAEEDAIPARAAMKYAADAGISAGTLRRAKEALGVRATRKGFGNEGTWYWSLDPENTLTKLLRASAVNELTDRLFSVGDDDE